MISERTWNVVFEALLRTIPRRIHTGALTGDTDDIRTDLFSIPGTLLSVSVGRGGGRALMTARDFTSHAYRVRLGKRVEHGYPPPPPGRDEV